MVKDDQDFVVYDAKTGNDITRSVLTQIIFEEESRGVVAAPNRPAYTASKHAVVGLTKQMALEFGEKGIRINAVGPGVTRTAMTAHYFEDPEITASIRSIHAMNRWAEVDEIARAILFLASDNASFITGTTLIVDGGWTTGKKM
jgi:NAD(P)-dependent dehydrogenase (short-subunit alcohol dehydrogenase family)